MSPIEIRRRNHPSETARAVALATSLLATGGVAGVLALADRPEATRSVRLATSTSPASSSTPTTTTPDTYRDGTWLGPTVTMRWGPVQVQATVDNGRLVAVDLVQWPSDGKSGRINSYAQPVLESEAVAAQSASIDVVSGATYTSQAYATSLQAALDSAATGNTAQTS